MLIYIEGGFIASVQAANAVAYAGAGIAKGSCIAIAQSIAMGGTIITLLPLPVVILGIILVIVGIAILVIQGK